MSELTVPLSYRIILRAYPRSFREQFGPEMARLFLDRRRDGANGAGLALREAGDCLRIAPRLHLEGSMSRTVTVIVALLIATVALALAGGGSLAVIPATLLAVVLVVRRGERPIGAPGWRWWSWLIAGAAALAVTFVVLASDGDDGELTTAGFAIAFISFNAALVLALIGLATGASRLHQHLRASRV